jgi:DNA processing protein
MIKEGAKLVMGITDILEELNIADVQPKPQKSKKGPNALEEVPEQLSFAAADDDEPVEQELLNKLTDAPLHIDDIQRSSGLPISSVSSTLTMLELKGKIKQVGCMHYIRIRENTAVYDN